MIELPEETEPLTDQELADLPVFPLPRVVFFPGSTLPLHLFEERYREMMEDCVSKGPMAMAVTLLRGDWEDDYEGSPEIHEIAGAGRILDWQRRDDGRSGRDYSGESLWRRRSRLAARAARRLRRQERGRLPRLPDVRQQ